MKCKLFKLCPPKLVKEFKIMELKFIISNPSSKHNLKEYIVVSYKIIQTCTHSDIEQSSIGVGGLGL